MRSFDMSAGSFPAGATISVVKGTARGTVVTTATADADGGATLTGLIHGTHYIASSGTRDVSFRTDPLPDPPIYNPLDFFEDVGMGNAAKDSAAIQAAGDQSIADIGHVNLELTSPPGATAYYVQGVTWGAYHPGVSSIQDGKQSVIRGQAGWRDGTVLRPADPNTHMFRIYGVGNLSSDGVTFERLMFRGTADRPFDVGMIELVLVRGFVFDQCGLEYDGSGLFLHLDGTYLGEIRRPSSWRGRKMVMCEIDGMKPLPAFTGPPQMDTIKLSLLGNANSQPVIIRGSSKESHGVELDLKHVNGEGDKGGTAGEPNPGYHYSTNSVQVNPADTSVTVTDASKFRVDDFITVGDTKGQVEVFTVATKVGSVLGFAAGEAAAFTHVVGGRVRKLKTCLLEKAYDAGSQTLAVSAGLGTMFTVGAPSTVGFGNAIDAGVLSAVGANDVTLLHPLRFPKGKAWTRAQTDKAIGDQTLIVGTVSGALGIVGRQCVVGVPGNQETLTIQSVNSSSNTITWTTPMTKQHSGGAPVSTACGLVVNNAAIGAVSIDLDNAAQFRKYGEIVLSQGTAREERAKIDSIVGNTLTFATPTTYAHNIGDEANFCSLLTSHGVGLSLGENLQNVKVAPAHFEDVPIGVLCGRVKALHIEHVSQGAAVLVYRADDCQDVRIEDLTAIGQPTGNIAMYTPPWVAGSTEPGRYEVLGAQQTFTSAWLTLRQWFGDFSRAWFDFDSLESGNRVRNQSRNAATVVVNRLLSGMNKRFEQIADGSMKFYSGNAGAETLVGAIKRFADNHLGSDDAQWTVTRQATGDTALAVRLFADPAYRFLIRAGGVMRWGPDGIAATDSEISRRGLNALLTTGHLEATYGVKTRYVSGPGRTTVTDADWPGATVAAPTDGTLCVHFDTTAAKTYLSVRANGAWFVMAGPV